MSLEFYRDEAGDPRARAVPAGGSEALARFLESDLQGSAASGLEILAAIESVAEGRLPEWTRTGNAHTLILSPEGAAIEADFADDGDAGLVSLADLREAVTRWIEFLDGGARH
ncbi:MAG TPA: YacL family protein [Thermoanaerobaculia bacterium]|nr:YacL family protein [Thermoanaerobaculia bacterium]